MNSVLNTVTFRLAMGYGMLVLGAVAVFSAILYFGTVGVQFGKLFPVISVASF